MGNEKNFQANIAENAGYIWREIIHIELCHPSSTKIKIDIRPKHKN